VRRTAPSYYTLNSTEDESRNVNLPPSDMLMGA
jgi:hypothetical protein